MMHQAGRCLRDWGQRQGALHTGADFIQSIFKPQPCRESAPPPTLSDKPPGESKSQADVRQVSQRTLSRGYLFITIGKERGRTLRAGCEQMWAQTDFQGIRKLSCHTLSLLFQPIFLFPHPARLTQCPNPGHSFSSLQEAQVSQGFQSGQGVRVRV